MKIKKDRLQQIIREELTRVLGEQADNDMDTIDIVDVETGEVLYIGAGTKRGIPAAKADEFIEKLSLSVRGDDKDGTERSIELSSDDFEKLEAHIDDVYDRPEREKQRAADQADQERLNIDNLKKRLSDWADDAARGWEADHASGNQEYPIDVVAFDLADSAQHHFQADEWDELLWHFDNNEDQLREFIMGSM